MLLNEIAAQYIYFCVLFSVDRSDIIINSYAGAFAQIINSITHAYDDKEKGLINILKDNSNLTIEYKDDGSGIKEKDLEHIFDQFFTTNRGKGGTELGLNIIYNIVN